MTIVGQRQNPNIANLHWRHTFAEDTGLESDSVDAVTVTLVLHECPDHVKVAQAAEAFRILKPGGVFIVTDTPVDDLHQYKGFHEPYKEEWLHFDPASFLAGVGFADVQDRGILGQEAVDYSGNGGTFNRVFVWSGRKPAAAAKL